MPDDVSIRPFRIDVPNEVLDDVHQRPARTVGVAVYPKEIVTPVRSWMEADYPNIVHWSEQPKGGHFAAFEQPDLFVADVRACFRQLR